MTGLFFVRSPAHQPRSLTHHSRHPALRGCRPRRAAFPLFFYTIILAFYLSVPIKCTTFAE